MDLLFSKVQAIVNKSQRVLVIQADNPDADSLGSALALEQILGEAGKYCGVEVPTYLRYIDGWSRVSQDLPSNFDASIIVDTSAMSLLQKLQESGKISWVAGKPCIVLDHHDETDNDIYFATVTCNSSDVSSAGELIFELAKQFGWKLDKSSAEHIMTAILGDTQGLTNSMASPKTYRVMAELCELGANRPHLEELRREASKMDPKIFSYKADLIKRTEFVADGKMTIVTVPQEEINKYSPLYNPAPLIQADMLQTSGVEIAVVIKNYTDGKMLGSIRCNQNAPIAAELAKHFGGGGHNFASGFKVQDGRPFNEIKSECISFATELLDKLNGKAK
jgi:phosphoesterase RecJ-like protein